MQFIKSPVSTIVIGQACSMGSFLAMAGEPGKRNILPNARTMIHQPSGGAGGQATDMEIQVKEIINIKEKLTKLYEKHNTANKSYDELAKAMERDNYLSAEEAVAFGLADKVVSRKT